MNADAMNWILIGCLSVAAIVVLDRSLLWLEAHGWIYYRRKKAISSGCANALIEIQAMFEPGMHEVIEKRHAEDEDDDESGDKPKDLNQKRL